MNQEHAAPSARIYQIRRPDHIIVFNSSDLEGPDEDHVDALVVTTTVVNFLVKKILVDGGSSADIMYLHAFKQLGIDNARFNPVSTPLKGFTGEGILSMGEVELPVSLGEDPCRITKLIKFPRRRQTITLQHHSGEASHPHIQVSTFLLPSEVEVPYSLWNGRNPGTEQQLINFLRHNGDVFAWKAQDLSGIPPQVALHRLNVDKRMKPVKQRKRTFGPERNKHIKAEVAKLLEAGHIRPVQYPEWLSNVVLVPKPGGKWRLCVDFTDLNKACPKDPFPLPRIDQLIDSTSGCELLNFLDAYQGYNQILLAPEDQERASFITDQGIYCYQVMPFGLKNAGASV
ncbi:PREDICTED: uncharacterized protein LOC105949008 [Erythranthe guttata]|uniref:uncharacterized protein LOC105949008 n=1 Tax=Erythranthe guttata TaxID=4155 RepID=UPI00064DE484|nr:PREDICTED: uncharacterized protein LOC105949008 [Erythranthe guttata]|eukprot:XP_012827728.1 PREDICTED: uncharacterized protein LOC105949008 [Erythranthe guttata]